MGVDSPPFEYPPDIDASDALPKWVMALVLVWVVVVPVLVIFGLGALVGYWLA